MRVVIVAEHASVQFGGEAARPLHYFKTLVSRGVDTKLVVHARTRDELQNLVPELMDRVYFVEDRWSQKLLWRVGDRLPERVKQITISACSHFITQWHQRKLVRQLVKSYDIDVVHEPTPISPKLPSLMYSTGAPVVIGPLNGNMNYPPGFQGYETRWAGLVVNISRWVAHPLNWLIPGKRQASAILVSNQRTAEALPQGCGRRVVKLVANAVDTQLWSLHGEMQNRQTDNSEVGKPVFVYLGRLVQFKAVDVLIEAFAQVVEQMDATLVVIGDGAERDNLQKQSVILGVDNSVKFTGWLSHEEAIKQMKDANVFVFPSLLDPGGAVVMEAMCLGLPVIATKWGGPEDYLVEGAGILVEPVSRDDLVKGFAQAMEKLGGNVEQRQAMAKTAYSHAMSHFDWVHRVKQLMVVYENVIHKTKGL